MVMTPSSHPLMTWPTPMMNVNGSLRSTEESNFLPFSSVMHGHLLPFGGSNTRADDVIDILQAGFGGILEF